MQELQNVATSVYVDIHVLHFKHHRARNTIIKAARKLAAEFGVRAHYGIDKRRVQLLTTTGTVSLTAPGIVDEDLIKDRVNRAMLISDSGIMRWSAYWEQGAVW